MAEWRAGGQEPGWDGAQSAPRATGVSFPVKAPPLDPGVLEQARRSEVEWRQDPEAARGREMMAHSVGVNVSGQAQVDQTFHFDLAIGLDSEVRAVFDTLRSLNFAVPLVGSADTGRMDTDAAPQRTGGIGRM
jgi:hypothetical protein